MKKFIPFLLWTLASTVLAANHWPAPVGYVNDFAHVIPADQAQALESFLQGVEQKTGSEITVVTVPSVEGGDVDAAAVELFKAWGIGKKGKDNGVLILAAIQDRRARIEVGYGLEGVLTDGDAGDILRQQVYPSFKQQQYGEGLINAAEAIVQKIAPDADGQTEVQSPGDEGSGGLSWIQIFFIILLILFFIIGNLTRMGRGYWGGGGFYGGGWGGGGFGGGGGGGFGGFGGGGSGGGGASGGW